MPLGPGQGGLGSGSRHVAARALLTVLIALLAIGVPVSQSTAETGAESGVAAPSPSPSETLALLQATPRPVRDPIALASRLTGAAIPWAATQPFDGPLPVGRRDSFFVLDQRNNRYVAREAELRVVSERAYWYVEVGQDVRQDDLERSAARFDTVTYPAVHRHFGTEWSPGIDGDPRITTFIGTVPGVGAYFSNWDEYPRTVFPYSNEREMIHLNVGGARPGTDSFDGTLAHEFQHMVHWQQNPAGETWLDEGSAELASFLAVPGRSPGASQFARDPDLQLTAWDQERSTSAHYQASFLFARYFERRFGADALRELIATGERPPESIDRYLARTGLGQTFDELFGDWVIANLLDAPDVADGRFAYADIEHHAAIGARLATGGPPVDADVRQYGADYVELTGTGGDAELVFASDAIVRLVGADPTSGRALWWSNRGDGLDSTMTRRFDLGGVAGATLRFNAWYDTERDYDYLYVMASTDEGRTWQVLRGALANDANPVGNALGPGYSGRSGSQASRGEPGWVAETVDLSPFAGAEVLIRFEYVTDQATNYRGALVDDIQVPEIGYADDAEADSGWAYDGFLRSDNWVPQRWGLRLVEYRRGGEIVVRSLAVGEDGRLTEPLPSLGGDLERAVLAISGLAPRTLEPARYQVALRPAP
ncbi:MAG: immune inhibitor A [Chloroflexota bacterium]|nr:immune inhibitor A [Chloroflexota bacterium]